MAGSSAVRTRTVNYSVGMSHPAPTIANNLGLVVQRLPNTEVGHVAEITFAFRLTGGITPQTAVDNFQGAWDLRIMPHMANTVTTEPPSIKVGDGSNVPHVAVGAGSPTTGGINGDYPPPNCAALVKKTSGLGGKKNRGRTYIPYIVTEGQTLNNGTITAGTVATLQTALSNFFADCTAGNIIMVIANKTLVLTPPDAHPHVTAITTGPDVTAFDLEAVMATQRRRLRS